MILQNQTVICIKKESASWEMFNQNYYVKELPKRIDVLMLESGSLGHKFDTNVDPSKRYPSHYDDISRWATHLFCLGKFIHEQDSEWLLISETDVNLGQITDAEPGITLYNDEATVYIIDRSTAKTVLDNSLIYYTPFNELLSDLKKIGLINIHKNTNYFCKISYLPYYDFIPLILTFMLVFLILCPFYSLIAKSLISLTKVAATKETMVSR